MKPTNVGHKKIEAVEMNTNNIMRGYADEITVYGYKIEQMESHAITRTLNVIENSVLRDRE